MTTSTPRAPVAPAIRRPLVEINNDCIVVEHLEVKDSGLAAFVAEHEIAEWPEVVERAIRVGLIALQGAGVTINLEAVQHAFETFAKKTEDANKRAADDLDRALRREFEDDKGRLPLTLEKFLGHHGQLEQFVSDLFDEKRGDSAAARLKSLLQQYVDGDESKLAVMLNPDRPGSPLSEFKKDMEENFKELGEQIAHLQGRKEERRGSAAKGGDFEDAVQAILCELAKGSGDDVECTADAIGALPRAKKGDFVVSLDQTFAKRHELRVVVEVKDRYVPVDQMRKEMEEARRNRQACVGLAVLSTDHAQASLETFDIRGKDVYCVLDPAAPDPEVLKVALRLSRLLALQTLVDEETTFDNSRIAEVVSNIRHHLQTVSKAKTQLGVIGRAATKAGAILQVLQQDIVRELDEADRLLKSSEPERVAE